MHRTFDVEVGELRSSAVPIKHQRRAPHGTATRCGMGHPEGAITDRHVSAADHAQDAVIVLCEREEALLYCGFGDRCLLWPQVLRLQCQSDTMGRCGRFNRCPVQGERAVGAGGEEFCQRTHVCHVLQCVSLFVSYIRKGEIEYKPLKTKKASNLEAYTFTGCVLLWFIHDLCLDSMTASCTTLLCHISIAECRVQLP